MRRSSPDDIYARVPVDRVAARVVAPGQEYVPDKKVVNHDSDLPLSIRPFNKAEVKAQGFIDLRAHRFGRFIVLGISAEHQGRWVVRCACGRYSTRTTKAIKNPRNSEDRCEHCRHLAFLKREEYYRRHGKDKD